MALIVSNTTPTIIIKDVPVKDNLDTENTPEIMIGIIATTKSPAAPIKMI